MILGHQKQWKFLEKSAELGKLPHALLFCGQEQLGKKTLAVEFAKFLNCQSKNEKPCHTCRNCQDIKKGIFPDFIFIEPDASVKEIKIFQMRELIEKLSLRPYASSFKIAVLNNAHLMTREAQNCFLKFLEEPKGKTVLILITEYPETLLPTIISRVQKIKFFPVKIEEIKNYFLLQGVSDKEANYFSSLSSGKPGKALNFYLNPEELEKEKKLVSDLIKISQSDLAFRFQYVKSFSDLSQNNLKEILNGWLTYFRLILLSRFDGQKKMGDFSHYSLFKIEKIIKNIQTMMFLISSTNINSKMAFENLLIEL